MISKIDYISELIMDFNTWKQNIFARLPLDQLPNIFSLSRTHAKTSDDDVFWKMVLEFNPSENDDFLNINHFKNNKMKVAIRALYDFTLVASKYDNSSIITKRGSFLYNTKTKEIYKEINSDLVVDSSQSELILIRSVPCFMDGLYPLINVNQLKQLKPGSKFILYPEKTFRLTKNNILKCTIISINEGISQYVINTDKGMVIIYHNNLRVSHSNREYDIYVYIPFDQVKISNIVIDKIKKIIYNEPRKFYSSDIFRSQQPNVLRYEETFFEECRMLDISIEDSFNLMKYNLFTSMKDYNNDESRQIILSRYKSMGMKTLNLQKNSRIMYFFNEYDLYPKTKCSEKMSLTNLEKFTDKEILDKIRVKPHCVTRKELINFVKEWHRKNHVLYIPFKIKEKDFGKFNINEKFIIYERNNKKFTICIGTKENIIPSLTGFTF